MRNLLCLMALAVSCSAGGPVNIRAIANNPEAYVGDTLTLRVKFYGWGAVDKPLYGIAKTRSDWVIADETGACHVTGKSPYPVVDPEFRGKEAEIRVIVHPEDTTFWLQRVE
ncbi:MAG: hypothetical protein ACP5QG_07405 [candidate division WOR-3 bacterium]